MIFSSWKESFTFLSPAIVAAAARAFVRASALMVRYFPLLFVADAALLTHFRSEVANFLSLAATSLPVEPVKLGYFLMATVWFVINTFFFIAVRRNAFGFDPVEFRIGFFRYLQLSFAFLLLTLIWLVMVTSLGVTSLPQMHWLLPIVVKIFSITTAFYWLDSRFSFSDFFFSIEQAVNLVAYNLPFFVGVLSLALLGNLALGVCASYAAGSAEIAWLWSLQANFGAIFFGKLQGAPSWLLFGSWMVCRLVKLLFDYFLIAFVLIFYLAHRRQRYAESFFEQ